MSTCKGSIITYATFTNPKEKKAEAKKVIWNISEIIKKEDKVYTELNKISEDIIEVLNGNEYVIA